MGDGIIFWVIKMFSKNKMFYGLNTDTYVWSIGSKTEL